MIQDNDPIPTPSHVSDIMNQADEAHLVALIEADIFAVKAAQENKAIKVNITLSQPLLEAMDLRVQELGMNRPMFIEEAIRQAI